MDKADRFEFHPVQAEGNVEKVAELLIERAAELRVSDLYIGTNEHNTEVAVRHLGIVRRLTVLPREQGNRLINHVKAMGEIDIGDHRRPGDGRWLCKIKGMRIDLRINAIPTLYGEDVTIRLLIREAAVCELDKLGLMQQEYNQLIGMVNNPSGLILVTGPTGSGKTSTLYSCIHFLNTGKRKINTLEDPIEYSVEGVRQSQIHAKIGVDFPELLTHVLRQSPDVIMIGEIRDPTTAAIAVRAANSGHLVLATLHAPVAAAAIDSMRALGIHAHFLSTGLIGAISQRLVRVLCDKCRRPVDVSYAPHTFEDVVQFLQGEEGKMIYGPGGCDNCHHTGYTSRTGVFEILAITPQTRKMILEQRNVRDMEKQAISEGMLEFRRSALVRVAQGVTSMEEVFRVIPSDFMLDED